MIGIVSSDSKNIVQFHMESFIGWSARQKPTATSTTLNGIDCWKVEYISSDDRTVRTWIAPGMGFGVLRMEVQFEDSAGVPFLSRSDCTLAQDKVSGIWFPHLFSYRRHVRGKVEIEEDLEVQVVSLNQALDPKLFTLEGIDCLPSGEQVSWVSNTPAPASGYLIWNGRELVSGTPPAIPRLDQPQRGGNSLLIFIIAVLCAVAAAFCAWRYFKTKPRSVREGQAQSTNEP